MTQLPMTKKQTPVIADKHVRLRAAICDAAMRLFSEKGFEAVTIRAIARELGSSPMRMYRYFPSKDALFVELRQLAFSNFESYLRRSVNSHDPVEKRLRQTCYAYLRFAVSAPDDYRLMFDHWIFDDVDATVAIFGDAALRHPESFEVLQGCLRDYLQERQVDADVNLIGHMFWISLHGLASLSLSRKLEFGLSPQKLAGPMVEGLISQLDSQAWDNPGEVKLRRSRSIGLVGRN